MWFKKSQKLFCQQQNLDQEKSKKVLSLVFRDYSCFFSRKNSRNVFFLLSAILWQYIRHWLGKTSLEFVGPQGSSWEDIFGLFLVQVLLLAK